MVAALAAAIAKIALELTGSARSGAATACRRSQSCQVWSVRLIAVTGAGLLCPQEAVRHAARVNVVSGDPVRWVVAHGEGALAATSARARNVERGDSTVRGAHEAVKYVARVSVISSNRTCRVDAKGEGALLGSRASAGSVERGKGAVASPHEAMGNIA